MTIRGALLRLICGAVKLLPNLGVLNYAAEVYRRKYYNYENTNMYHNSEFHWLKQALAKPPKLIVFDVGANVGNWSAEVLKLRPDAVIHAFEPFSATYHQLEARRLPGVTIQNMGLGAEAGQKEFFVYESASEHNSLFPRHDNPYSSVARITITTLDTYCAAEHIDHIDYLKIDTEGYDYFVLKGAARMLREGRIDVIQFEYGNNYIDARVFLKDIYDFFEPLPYSIYRIMPRRLLPLERYNHNNEVFIYANYVAIRDKST